MTATARPSGSRRTSGPPVARRSAVAGSTSRMTGTGHSDPCSRAAGSAARAASAALMNPASGVYTPIEQAQQGRACVAVSTCDGQAWSRG